MNTYRVGIVLYFQADDEDHAVEQFVNEITLPDTTRAQMELLKGRTITSNTNRYTDYNLEEDEERSFAVKVIIPYGNDTTNLVIDPAAVGANAREIFLVMASGEWTTDELGRILVGAALLWDANAGTIGECLETAIIWARG